MRGGTNGLKEDLRSGNLKLQNRYSETEHTVKTTSHDHYKNDPREVQKCIHFYTKSTSICHTTDRPLSLDEHPARNKDKELRPTIVEKTENVDTVKSLGERKEGKNIWRHLQLDMKYSIFQPQRCDRGTG